MFLFPANDFNVKAVLINKKKTVNTSGDTQMVIIQIEKSNLLIGLFPINTKRHR